MNIKKFNEQFNVKDLLNLAVSKNWKQYDQDLFNYLCGDNVKIVDAAWNFMEDIYGSYQSLPKPLFQEFLKSEKNPKIIHFAGNRKPWIKIDSKLNKHFWQYAEKTPFLNELKALENMD
jgi:lipopolysaccharide biosynthesis glycosyltransferase